jgi:glutaredoxin-like protein NrdH
MIEMDCLHKVAGDKSKHDLVLFALSTCGWCRKARSFLDENSLAYRYVYVDELEGEEQKDCLERVTKYNPRRSFPTLVVDDNETLVGFDESEYKEKVL